MALKQFNTSQFFQNELIVTCVWIVFALMISIMRSSHFGCVYFHEVDMGNTMFPQGKKQLNGDKNMLL